MFNAREKKTRTLVRKRIYAYILIYERNVKKKQDYRKEDEEKKKKRKTSHFTFFIIKRTKRR
jgi:hypothetical protein